MAEMKRLTSEAMAQGAVGLTCAWHGGGPEFPDEVAAMLNVAARTGGYYGVHLGSEGDQLIEELQKALDIGRQAMIPVHVYHLKARGRHNWGLVQQAIAMIEAARAEGVAVVRNPALEMYQGRRVSEIARMRGQGDDPAETVFDIIHEEGNFPGGVFHNMSEEDVQTVMPCPWVAVASDGTALNLNVPGFPHPRSFGTNVRVLGKYVRDDGVLRLEDAVRKMTSLPAQVLRLSDRGVLRQGYWADVVIFDPDQVADRATFEQPKQYPVGIEYVLVNGQLVVDHGEHTGARPGQVLYGAGKQRG
jgi:N-acyl-D-aspartate/D-glutamate deacylase